MVDTVELWFVPRTRISIMPLLNLDFSVLLETGWEGHAAVILDRCLSHAHLALNQQDKDESHQSLPI